MQAGDLVFFRTRGKHVSHVGIYLGDGQFIHAPTTGERVKVSNLGESYWARRFAGARRPQTTA
jgi:cell wall-associated NlpC family hydrolase